MNDVAPFCPDLTGCIDSSTTAESVRMIWLGSSTRDDLEIKMMLLELNEKLQSFEDLDSCVKFIQSSNDDDVLLIITSIHSKSIVQQLISLRSSVAIFLYYNQVTIELNECSNCPKVVGTYGTSKSLQQAIEDRINLIHRQRMTFSLFASLKSTTSDLWRESASFLWHQLIIDVLKKMNLNEQALDDMVNLCKSYYCDNKTMLEKIEEFRRNYRSDSVIKWYTTDCFVYKLLNKAFRTDDLTLIYFFRQYIIDLCAEIEYESRKIRNEGVVKLYRGQKMLKDEVERLKNGVGGLIAVKGFMSTSRDVNVALSFIADRFESNMEQSVLLEIQTDTMLKSIIFADIAERSAMRAEDEVLFSLNAVFVVDAVKFDSSEQLWRINLTATDKGSEKVTDYLRTIQQQVDLSSPIVYFGELLWRHMGESKKAETYFKIILKTLPSDRHRDIASVHNLIGAIYHEKLDLNTALKKYEIAYAIRLKNLAKNDPHIGDSLNNIATIYQNKRQFHRSLHYYQQALDIYEKRKTGLFLQAAAAFHLKQARTIANMGVLFRELRNVNKALKYLDKALNMYSLILPDQYPEIAKCLEYHGLIYLDKNDFDLALDFFRRALSMTEETLHTNHKHFSRLIHLIVSVHKAKGHTTEPVNFCDEQLVRQREKLDSHHPRIIYLMMQKANALENENLNEAIHINEEALRILETQNVSDQEVHCDCLLELARMYRLAKRYTDALSCAQNALARQQCILSPMHPSIANTLADIALLHEDLGNYDSAFKCLKESVIILESIYDSDHINVKKLRRRIAKVTKHLPKTESNSSTCSIQ